MRIALVVERFEAAGGGVEQVAWNVARELKRAGDEVHVIARHGEAQSGIQLHRLNVPRLWQPLRVGEFSRQSARMLRRHDFDVVHSFSRTLHQDVFHAGGGSHADYMRNAYGSVGAQLRRLSPRHALLLEIERRIFADPHQVIQCVSGMVQRQISKRFGVPQERLPIIYNGVDLERFAPERNAAERPKLRDANAAGDATVWLLSGSGWRRKGLDTALAALAALPNIDTHLWVAGADAPSAWREMAVQLGIRDRVRFLGQRSDLERYYAAADGLLLPSRYDAFGLVCLEAAAAGLPVITSGATGAAELLAGAGVVVPDAEDVPGFREALESLADPALRARLGEAGRRVAARHGWSTQVSELRSLYGTIRR